jgi:glycosyltransferase involved in cell wall biosynthesis
LSRPLFSIIVPTYGRSEMLRCAVDSVLSQTVTDFECIVVDDASLDSLVVPDDPRIKVVRREVNGGPAAARNTGLAHATGHYITFLDDDDVYVSERLNMVLDGLRKAPISICWSRYLNESNTWNRVLRGDVRDTIVEATTPLLGATTIKAEYVIPFDERYVAVQDVEWWLRLAHTAKVWTTESVGYLVRRHGSPRHMNSTAARVRCSLLLLDMYAGYFNVHPRAAAFRWKRVGLMARNLGDYSLARRAFVRSLFLRPEARTVLHLARSLKLSTGRVPPLGEECAV